MLKGALQGSRQKHSEITQTKPFPMGPYVQKGDVTRGCVWTSKPQKSSWLQNRSVKAKRKTEKKNWELEQIQVTQSKAQT